MPLQKWWPANPVMPTNYSESQFVTYFMNIDEVGGSATHYDPEFCELTYLYIGHFSKFLDDSKNTDHNFRPVFHTSGCEWCRCIFSKHTAL